MEGMEVKLEQGGWRREEVKLELEGWKGEEVKLALGRVESNQPAATRQETCKCQSLY
jgi:hypothetical protein